MFEHRIMTGHADSYNGVAKFCFQIKNMAQTTERGWLFCRPCIERPEKISGHSRLAQKYKHSSAAAAAAARRGFIAAALQPTNCRKKPDDCKRQITEY